MIILFAHDQTRTAFRSTGGGLSFNFERGGHYPGVVTTVMPMVISGGSVYRHKGVAEARGSSVGLRPLEINNIFSSGDEFVLKPTRHNKNKYS